MKVVDGPFGLTIELTRRNLRTLLLKLDRYADSPGTTARTIALQVPTASGEVETVYVKAVEDEEHYADREPGRMAEAEEEQLRLWYEQPGR